MCRCMGGNSLLWLVDSMLPDGDDIVVSVQEILLFSSQRLLNILIGLVNPSGPY